MTVWPQLFSIFPLQVPIAGQHYSFLRAFLAWPLLTVISHLLPQQFCTSPWLRALPVQVQSFFKWSFSLFQNYIKVALYFYNFVALTNSLVLIFHSYLSRMIRKERPNFATTRTHQKLTMSFVNVHHEEIAQNYKGYFQTQHIRACL